METSGVATTAWIGPVSSASSASSSVSMQWWRHERQWWSIEDTQNERTIWKMSPNRSGNWYFCGEYSNFS